jgi:hypothetical protein
LRSHTLPPEPSPPLANRPVTIALSGPEPTFEPPATPRLKFENESSSKASERHRAKTDDCPIIHIIGQNGDTAAGFPHPERHIANKKTGIIRQNALSTLFLTIF